MSGSKSESSSQNTSEFRNISESISGSENFQESGSQQFAGNEAFNESQNRTFVDPNQQGFLNSLFQQGAGLAGQQLGAGSGFDQFTSSAMQNLQNMFQPSAQANPFLQQQIGMGQNLINENLQQNILPSVGSGAQVAGQFGGGRQGVAEGIALRDANRQSSDFAQNLIGQDFQGQQNRALQALGQAGNIGNLAFQPLNNLRSILGGTTVLGEGAAQGGSSGFSGGSSFGVGGGSSFGESSSLGFGGSQGTSDSKSASLGK